MLTAVPFLQGVSNVTRPPSPVSPCNDAPDTTTFTPTRGFPFVPTTWIINVMLMPRNDRILFARAPALASVLRTFPACQGKPLSTCKDTALKVGAELAFLRALGKV